MSLQCDFFSGETQIFRARLLDSGVSLLSGVLQVWAGYFGWALVFVWDGAFFFGGGGQGGAVHWAIIRQGFNIFLIFPNFLGS